MSRLFGWDLPPGCSSVPGDEYGTFDLSERVTALMSTPTMVVPCLAYWGEDGALIGCRASDLKSSEDDVPFLKQDCDWDDNLSEAENLDRAAAAVAAILKEQKA